MPPTKCDEAWTAECRFWLPSEQDVFYGSVDYAPTRGPGVHVLDSPLGRRQDLEEPPPDVPLLQGETLGGTPLTLFDGWVVGSTIYGLGVGSTVDVLFKTLVWGDHLSTLADVRSTTAGVALQGLLELLTGGAVDQSLLRVTSSEQSHDQIGIELPGRRLQLGAGSGASFSRGETSIKVNASARFEYTTERDLAEVDRDVSILRDLIVFSTRQPSWIRSLRLFPGTVSRPSSADRVPRELTVVRAPVVEPVQSERSSASYSLMLNPGSVEDPGALISRWYGLEELLGPVWPLYFATLQRPDLPLENQLLNLTAFAEGYHRTLHDQPPLGEEEAAAAVEAMLGALTESRQRAVYRPPLKFANSQSQRQRIRWLADRALEVIDVWELDVARFCSQIADTRNWLTHWGKRGKHVQSGDGLVRLLHQLDLVLATNLMLDLDLDSETVLDQIGSGMRLVPLP